MQFDNFSFGSIQIDGSTYEHNVVIDRGEIRKRKKKLSKKFREEFGHTPLSVEENIPPTRHRHLCLRPIARDAGSTARGIAPKDQAAGSANRGCHQGFGTRPEGQQCNPPRDVLGVCRRRSQCTKFGQLTLSSVGRTVRSNTDKSFPPP